MYCGIVGSDPAGIVLLLVGSSCISSCIVPLVVSCFGMIGGGGGWSGRGGIMSSTTERRFFLSKGRAIK